MKKYLLLITVALIVAPLVAAGCTSPTSPSPSPSTAASTAASSATVAASTAVASPSAAALPSPTASPTASQLSYTVTIPNTAAPYSFQPVTMTVPRGASVTWRNEASAPHQIVSNTGVFSGPVINSGQTYTYQFNQAGTYPYHCAIHTYMTGTIIVQ